MSSKVDFSFYLDPIREDSDVDLHHDPLSQKKQQEISQLMSLSPESLIFSKDAHFSPEQHLISSWTGDSLLSAEALLIRHHLNELWSLSLEQFDQIQDRNTTMKKSVYQEFYPYLDRTKHPKLKSADQLWEILVTPSHPLYDDVQTFKAIFTFRSVVIYFFKLRFMAHFARQEGHQLTTDEVLNPSTYIRHYFPNGSKYYFTSLALETNPYTWLAPKPQYAKELLELIPLFLKINLTELTKIITFTQTKYINLSEANNSHALSHRSFGHFINTLLVHAPRWLDSTLDQQPPLEPHFPHALKTLFVGDFLKSLIMSHSLDQEQQVVQKWQEIITANIEDNGFASARFFQICHELQTLTLLTKVAARQGHPQIALISTVMNEKYSRGDFFNTEDFLFHVPTDDAHLLYQRLILNLTTQPETNPYHYLIKRINQEMTMLQENGYLYVFTNQKIFVQSQVERFKTLLSKMKLEFTCDFSSLKGRGEVTKYLYVFSKRQEPKNKKQLMQQKENCPTFIFKGKLNHFAEFNTISNYFHNFLHGHALEGTSIISKHITNNIFFSFYQDTIIDGHILSAVQNGEKNVILPSFFEKITHNTRPFKDLFKVELFTHDENIADNMFGVQLNYSERYPFILVVDARERQLIKLDIIKRESIEAYQHKYGTVGFFYLKLLPLHHTIFIETIRSFFQDRLGIQLIQMAITEKSLTNNKITRSIENLLIPKFFLEITPGMGNNSPLSPPLLPLLESDPSTLLSYAPGHLKNLYEQSEGDFLQMLENSPSIILEKLIKFKQTLLEIKRDLRFNSSSLNLQIFNNPLLKQELMKGQFKNIFPNNEDIHIELLTDHSVEAPKISQVELIHNEDDHYLLLRDNYQQKDLAKIYSDIKLLILIKGAIENSKHTISLAIFMKNLRVPTLTLLNSALQTLEQAANQINLTIVDLEKIISTTFVTQLTKES